MSDLTAAVLGTRSVPSRADTPRMACADVPQAVFFPPARKEGGSYRRARRICGQCPAAERCLEEALAFEQGSPLKDRHGMFGGRTPSERLALDRRELNTCVVCGDAFLARRDRLACSTRCEKVRLADYHRTYYRLVRSNQKPNPIKKHGGPSCDKAGCGCVASRNARRARQRSQRVRRSVAA